jgi:hypothetical protein
VRRRLIARWAGRVVVSWGERRGSSTGRGIEAHMYRPLFFWLARAGLFAGGGTVNGALVVKAVGVMQG